MDTKKFLEFNGKSIYFLSKDGTYWIAIKPICEALEVNYNRQFQNIKSDSILAPAFAIQQMQVGNDQSRNWSCLPEFFIYGWIFQIKSESEKLAKYKWEVYQILYEYFKGTITQREKLLKIKTQSDIEIEQLEENLSKSKEFKRIQELKNLKKKTTRSLNSLDKDIVTGQYDLWSQKFYKEENINHS